MPRYKPQQPLIVDPAGLQPGALVKSCEFLDAQAKERILVGNAKAFFACQGLDQSFVSRDFSRAASRLPGSVAKGPAGG